MSAGSACEQCWFWLSVNCRVVTNEHPVLQTLKNVHTFAGHAVLLAVFPEAGSFCLISGEYRVFKAQRDGSVTRNAGGISEETPSLEGVAKTSRTDGITCYSRFPVP